MLLNRNELIFTLFRETDRAQRTRTPLALIHCVIRDWASWRAKAGETTLNQALQTIVERISRLLRCYDSVGQVAEGELVLVLPGCNSFNASTMAKRITDEVFPLPVEVDQRRIEFRACFGVAISAGRSPFVVLRDAERALQIARTRGAGAVYCSAADDEPDGEEFSLPTLEDEVRHK